jgi:hypothetical protein
MILAMAFSTQGFTPLSLKVDGCGIEKYKVKSGEKIPALQKHSLFNKVLDATGRKRSRVSLVFHLFAKKGHGAVKMMQRKFLDPFYHMLTAPFVTGPVGA